ncbi:head-tail connector protein [uncultured Maricaulis sp.]|uniref:head-tail connector protein n=1 Tax=uncultured Maricaulis sp. TaxID=174710 RepID=UPI0030D968EB|tara:strand:+ start:1321 stop:1923 length:603 start_codon:yes stop_codon:yes gene_type:complete
MTIVSTSTAVIAETGDEPVSLLQLKNICRAVADDEDDELRSWGVTARKMVESDSHRSLVRKTIRQRRHCWPAENYVELARGPLVSVESLQYIDTDGATQSIESADNWRIDTDRQPGVLFFDPEFVRPATISGRHDAITINYTAGYDTVENPAPAIACSAISMLVAHWYKNREATTVGVVSTELALGYERLIGLLLQETYP